MWHHKLMLEIFPSLTNYLTFKIISYQNENNEIHICQIWYQNPGF